VVSGKDPAHVGSTSIDRQNGSPYLFSEDEAPANPGCETVAMARNSDVSRGQLGHSEQVFG
jgi:hypothetical protein